MMAPVLLSTKGVIIRLIVQMDLMRQDAVSYVESSVYFWDFNRIVDGFRNIGHLFIGEGYQPDTRGLCGIFGKPRGWNETTIFLMSKLIWPPVHYHCFYCHALMEKEAND